MSPHHIFYHGLKARFGVSQWEITPGLDVCCRNWGAAKEWLPTGVHRKLRGTALAIAPQEDAAAKPLILISLELGWWRSRQDENDLRFALLKALGIPEQNLIISLTHTHAGPVLDSNPPPEASPVATAAYLGTLRDACIAGAQCAVDDLRESTLLFNEGKCSLASNRDLVDPNKPERYLTGCNPEGAADDTLLVGRLFDSHAKTRAVLVNYACHPTTLAWDNSLVSPDYPGIMREEVEQHTQAPCLFLLGACGELAPAEQYVGDVKTAERNGRQLAYSVLSALEGLNPGKNSLVYQGAVESGAPLASWEMQASSVPTQVHAEMVAVDLPLKKDLPTSEEIRKQIAERPSDFSYERLLRQQRLRASVGDGASSSEHLWFWQLGGVKLLANPFEAYSCLQTDLRSQHPDTPLLVINLANGALGYLPPVEMYEHDIYTVWQTPYAKGSLERIIQAVEPML